MKKFLMSMGALATLLLAPSLASAQTATPAVSLVHGIPGVTVDVSVDGAVVINNFAPGSIADISSFAGTTLTNFEVIDDSTQTTIIGPISSLDVPDTGNSSLVAYLDGTGNPTLGSFENNTAAVGAGEARLTVRHTAAAQPIDLVIGSTTPLTNVTNGTSSELTLPAGTLSDASIVPTGQQSPAVAIPAVDLGADTNTIVYVVGSESDDTIDFVVQVVALPTSSTTTTTVAGSTTTTVAGSTTTTTTIAGQTTTTTSTTTTVAPVQVNTGSPIDGSRTTYLLIAVLGGLGIAGISMAARRRV